jgi:hypothetical protein
VKDKGAGFPGVEESGKYGHWVDLPLSPCMEADFGHCILWKLENHYCDRDSMFPFSPCHIIIYEFSACCFLSIAFKSHLLILI